MSMQRRGFFAAVAVLVAGLLTLGSTPPAMAHPHHPAGAIQGTVTDAHHHPVSGAHVTLVDGHHHVVAKTTSGKHGAFHFPHVTPGHYTVRATGPHHTHGAAGVVVHAGHTATVHLVVR